MIQPVKGLTVNIQTRCRHLCEIAGIVVAFAYSFTAWQLNRDDTVSLVVGISFGLTGRVGRPLQPILRVVRLHDELISLLGTLQPTLGIVSEHCRRQLRIGIFDSDHSVLAVQIGVFNVSLRACFRELLLSCQIDKRRVRCRRTPCVRLGHGVSHAQSFQA
ncbi:hypothetical protein D3C85_997180 [compost metagenome]